MRLLERRDDGEFSLTDDLHDHEIPRYAILSHTWGAEEVTFRDLMDGTGKGKSGYNKICFCGEQARRDGLQYFWVDTCCIDKSSSAELSEAIISMFRWYRDAAKCYVYLSDIDTFNQQLPWESAFRKSRWFTRGWTLQELIAPSSVEFFSRDQEKLGNKESLVRLIHEITGIPVRALRGSRMSDFSVAERLSWAEKRNTTREEDEAYSLLGLFNIQIPALYGEGRENAFKRLREEIDKSYKILDSLPSAADAPFNSYTKQHEPTCLPDTRIQLLQKINNWADGQNEQCIFWLNGLAGTGKSTIARTIAGVQSQRGCLEASFFFSRGGGDVGHAGMFVTSLARQLTNSIPTLHQHICDALTEYSDITRRSLREQWHQLILRPLSKLDSNSCRSIYLLVVDALDECDNENDIRILLHLFAEVGALERVRLRVFLTSRPEIPIRHGFYQIPDEEHQDFVLHNIWPSIVDHDLTIFVEYKFKDIREERSLDANWPGEEAIKRLVQAASGLFIWAVTACRFVREGKRHAARRLDTILNSGGSASTVTAPEKHLDEIYTTVLMHSIPPEYTDEEKEESYRMLRQVLGSVVILFATLSIYSLSRLLRAPQEDLDQTVEDLHSILNIPKDKTQPLRLHHPSFRDFLLKNSRCQDPNLWVEEKHAHQMLAEGCIQLMSNVMKQDICDLGVPGKLATDVDTSRVEQYLPPELQYACLYWIPHLQQSSLQLRDNDQVHQFFQKHLLHWLEALGWMGKISDGILAISSLETQILADTSPNLHAFIYDIKRFALYNRSVIEQAPLQVYCSALVFAPENSIIRRQFETYIPAWIQRKPEVQADWTAVLQTLEGHSGWIISVAFSPDGKQVVSGSSDETVRLWDVVTGAALQTLEGHSGQVTSVAFSPDGKQVASGSYDETVRLWDAVTGAALQTLEGHSGSVTSVAFSSDGKQMDTLCLSNQWVTKGETNFLWLPPDYRATCEAIWNGIIVLGHSSGRISFLEFNKGSKFILE